MGVNPGLSRQESEAAQPSPDSAAPSATIPSRAVFAAVVGHFVEYFDYTVYGFFASVIGTHFFPASDPLASLAAAFAVFALAFALRPLGGIVFGHFGDRLGRRKVLALSVLLMGAGSLMIGVLPPYAAIGGWAPVLLVLARMVQGFSTGGENAGASSFLAGYARPRSRGITCSWGRTAIIAATVAGSGFAALLRATLSAESFNAWGWRLPFLLGAVLSVIGLYVRLRLEDTPAFRRLEDDSAVAAIPIATTFRHHWRTVLVGLVFYIAPSTGSYMLLIYMPSYGSSVFGIPPSQALLSNAIALVLLIALIPVTAALSDKVGRKPLLIIFNLALVAGAYPLILLFAEGTFVAALTAQLIFAVVISFFSGPGTAMAAELFPTRVRYTGFAISNNVATAMFGGTAPFIATWLVSATGRPTSPACYLIAAGAVSLVAVLCMRETANAPLRQR